MPRSRSYSRSRSPSPANAKDNKDVSPFLIRVFVTKGKHTPLLDFDDGKFPFRDEFHVYGWKSSTPTSLIALLYPSFPAPYRSPLARFAFRHVYVDASQRGLYRSKDLVSFSGRDLMNTLHSSNNSAGNDTAGTSGSNSRGDGKVGMDMELDDTEPSDNHRHNAGGHGGRKVSEKSLDNYGFITGDYLSVSLYVPEPKPSAGAANPNIGNNSNNGPQPPMNRDRELRIQGSSAPSNGDWARGEALPPPPSRSGRGGYNGPSRDREPRGGPPRDGGYRNAAGPPPVMGMGIRGGAGRRSPSVGRDRDRNGNGNGNGRRSRSPDYSRRRDRSP